MNSLILLILVMIMTDEDVLKLFSDEESAEVALEASAKSTSKSIVKEQSLGSSSVKAPDASKVSDPNKTDQILLRRLPRLLNPKGGRFRTHLSPQTLRMVRNVFQTASSLFLFSSSAFELSCSFIAVSPTLDNVAMKVVTMEDPLSVQEDPKDSAGGTTLLKDSLSHKTRDHKETASKGAADKLKLLKSQFRMIFPMILTVNSIFKCYGLCSGAELLELFSDEESAEVALEASVKSTSKLTVKEQSLGS
ncbi:hypothetical protein NE237_014599 [Protea cynaroides]|uniref:Uncharacterized protein n=1 Tax=Protea cynaroides TaxID=273540 RepID=A0A9Q0KCB0_9MAGN|nr:hypothetical protein NE237_014599 [Protea cynaroides]